MFDKYHESPDMWRWMHECSATNASSAIFESVLVWHCPRGRLAAMHLPRTSMARFLSSTPASVRQLPAPRIPWALVSLSLTMLLSSLGTSIANVALPTFVQVFGASFQAVQWVVLAYLLAITTLIVSVGRLGDLLGRRRLMLAGVGVFTIASAACAAAPQLWMLVVARAAQGFGAAVMMALTMAFVGDAVPKARAGSAMGLLGTMSAIGTALGPTLGGTLIAGFGWRAIFLINLPLGLLAIALVYRYLPADRVVTIEARAPFDYRGSLLLALTLAAYALAMTLGRGNAGPMNAALLCIACAGAGLFAFVEARASSPLVQLALFLDRVISAGFAMSGLVTTVAMTTLVVGPFYLSGALGLDAAHVGLVMSAGPLVAALVGVPAGRGVDRFGAASMTVAGLVTMVVGCIGLTAISPPLGAWGYIVPLVTFTAGFAIFQAANNTAVMTGIEAGQRGVVSGLLNLSRNLGLITGASVMGAVYAFGSATAESVQVTPGSATSGLRLAFAIATGLVIIALALALAAQSRARRISSVG
jgi:EmrB/QacA subfamily drug resistance transporter